jgi:hypothetical protein
MILPVLYLTLSVVTSFSLDREVFSSPSGKLTYSPEIVVPEPKDATAILLLSNSVQILSQRIRQAQANAAFLEGSVDALRTFCNEQATAAGNFPGPVPVIYCSSEKARPSNSGFKEVRDAGAKGVLIPVDWQPGGQDDDFAALDQGQFVLSCQAAADAGLAVIPELRVAHGDEIEVNHVVKRIENALSNGPAAIVLTYAGPPTVDAIDDDDDKDDQSATADVAASAPLPSVSKETTRRIPVLCSVRAEAGENRLADAADRVKAAGYSGAFLRSECLPGFRLQLDMEILSSFWQACISDLKSTRSKSFSFRAKNNMEVSAATKWGNYQKNVLESGALGDPNDSYSVVDSAAGEYKGFA